MNSAIHAVAEACASMDGNLDEYLEGTRGPDAGGYVPAYQSDAKELLKRIKARGYTLGPLAPGHWFNVDAE